MKNLKYESDQPLARLKPGDQATIIRVTHFPDGDHEARCVAPVTLECAKYPELNGRYNMWRGDKRLITKRMKKIFDIFTQVC